MHGGIVAPKILNLIQFSKKNLPYSNILRSKYGRVVNISQKKTRKRAVVMWYKKHGGAMHTLLTAGDNPRTAK